MLPIIVIAVAVIPLPAATFRATRRSKVADEHPIAEDDRTKQRIGQEFAEAKEYQEHRREKEKKRPRTTIR